MELIRRAVGWPDPGSPRPTTVLVTPVASGGTDVTPTSQLDSDDDVVADISTEGDAAAKKPQHAAVGEQVAPVVEAGEVTVVHIPVDPAAGGFLG